MLLVVGLAIAGCDGSPSSEEGMRDLDSVEWRVPADAPVPDGLKEKVLQFWNHYYRREWDACYDMETPENREQIKRQWYTGTYSNAWKTLSVAVERVVAEGDAAATVWLRTTHAHPHTGKPKETELGDKWRRVDGTWYHFYDDPVIRLRELGKRGADKP